MFYLEQEQLGYRGFLDQLSTGRERALLLDYDGTLAPFTTSREQAFPYAGVSDLLDKLVRTTETRVVVITGRPAKEIQPLLGIVPHLEVWGSHGLERLRRDGSYQVVAMGEGALQALAEADAAVFEEGLDKAMESKPGAVAVHWRGLGRAAKEVREAAYRALQPLSGKHGLVLAAFDGGLELRVGSRNKADAVRSVLSELPSDACVAYLGDDRSDEDAFRALRDRGLRVLVRPQQRPTEADVWLKPPEELIDFLAEWLRACGGEV